MANNTKKKESGSKGGASTMVYGTAGAVVGAAIGGATAAALANDKTRKKVGEIASDIIEDVEKTQSAHLSKKTKTTAKKKN